MPDKEMTQRVAEEERRKLLRAYEAGEIDRQTFTSAMLKTGLSAFALARILRSFE